MGFAEFVALPDGRMDALVGALLIAKDKYAGLDVARERARIDAIAEPLGRLEGQDPEEQASRLAEHLFSTRYFHRSNLPLKFGSPLTT